MNTKIRLFPKKIIYFALYFVKSPFFCHSDDRREEESRWHKVDVPEILRYTTFRSDGLMRACPNNDKEEH